MWKTGTQVSHCFDHVQVIHSTQDGVALGNMWTPPRAISLITVGGLDLGRAWPLWQSWMSLLFFWRGIDMVVSKSNFLVNFKSIKKTWNSGRTKFSTFTGNTAVCFAPNWAHNPQMRNHYGFHVIIQSTGPPQLSPAASTLWKWLFPSWSSFLFLVLVFFFFLEQLLRLCLLFKTFMDLKHTTMSPTWVVFSVGLLSLRMFSMYIRVVTCISSSFFFIVIKHRWHLPFKPF